MCFLGLRWRTEHDAMTPADWKRNLPAFAADACSRWTLPLCCPDEREDREGPVFKRHQTEIQEGKDRLRFRGSSPTQDELLDTIAPKIQWGSSEKRFVYTTDSQLLANLVRSFAIA